MFSGWIRDGLPGTRGPLSFRPRDNASQTELGAEDRAHAGAAGGLGETNRTVQAVMIGQRHRRDSQLARLRD
jgi:hypothetical protein